MQTWDDFHRFDPMEVIATAAETRALVARWPDRSYLLFPEDRKFPIRMSDDLPLRWIGGGPRAEWSGEACRGEFYAFQVGVFAARAAIDDLTVEISGLRREGDKSAPSAAIPAANFHAFNFRGVNWLGRPIAKRVAVPKGKVQALWFGVEIPKDAAPGLYRGRLAFRSRGGQASDVKLSLQVSPRTLADGGVGDLWRYARLKWLDSTLGLDDEVVAPYTPMSTSGATARCLGRTVAFSDAGLPRSIESNRREILAAPVALVVETQAGRLAWSGGRPILTQPAPGAVLCESQSLAGPLQMTCRAKMEFDGCLNYRIALKARRAVERAGHSPGDSLPPRRRRLPDGIRPQGRLSARPVEMEMERPGEQHGLAGRLQRRLAVQAQGAQGHVGHLVPL